MSFIARMAARSITARLERWPGHGRALTLAGTALLAAVVLAIGVTLWDLRQVAIVEAMENTDNMAIVLAEQTSRSVQTADIVLRDVQDRIAAMGITTPTEFRTILAAEETYQYLRGRLERVPQVKNLTLIDTNGHWVNYSIAWPAPRGDLSDRDYARHFATQNDPGLYISVPAVSRATGSPSLFLVRRVNAPSGEYLGLVLASVPLSVFHDLYKSINLPPGESLLLLRRDGTVLIRYPDARERAGAKIPAGSPWYKQVAGGGGAFETSGVFEGNALVVAARLLHDYPLVMDVARSEATILAQWRHEAALIAVGTAAAAICMLLMLHRLRLQFRRLEESRSTLTTRNSDLTQAAGALRESEAHLAATSHELEVTLSSMGQGLMTIDAEGRVAVCNRRAIEMLDLPAALMTSRPTLDEIPPLRWIAVELGLTTASGPSTSHADPDAEPPRGRERELPNGLIAEIGFAPLAGRNGWVVSCQDITARRHAERQIAFMARHDALTRLPNREMFRERIEMAINQTDRTINAAVLFLDLDHFKAVNDTLGHPVGDRLLHRGRAVGICVRQVDTVARFGGDEFAVIQIGPDRVEDVAVLAQRINDVLSAPYEVDGTRSSSLSVPASPWYQPTAPILTHF